MIQINLIKPQLRSTGYSVFGATPAKTFALIDNASGFIWWTGSAVSPEAACSTATLDTSGEQAEYTQVHSMASNQGGYLVYEAPALFAVLDGQNQHEIDTVTAMRLVGKFAVTAQ